MPVAVLMTIGKTASRKTTAILDGVSMPKIRMNSGARATVGVAYRAEIQGSMKSWATLLVAIRIPSAMPTTAASRNPQMNSFRLIAMWRWSWPLARSWAALLTIDDSGVISMGQRPLWPASSQAIPTIRNDSSARTLDGLSRYQRSGKAARPAATSRLRAASAIRNLPSARSGLGGFVEEGGVDVLGDVGRHVWRPDGLEVLGELRDPLRVG